MSTPALPDLDGVHRAGETDTSPTTVEPVRVAQLISTMLYAAVGLGWFTIPSTLIDSAGTAVAFLASVLASEWARGKVSPTGRISLDTIRGYIRAEVYAERDRLAASAPNSTELHATIASAVAQVLAPTIAAGQARATTANGKG
jgi:hypothetical protein